MLLTMFGSGRTACKLLAGAVANLLLAFSGDSLSERKIRSVRRSCSFFRLLREHSIPVAEITLRVSNVKIGESWLGVTGGG